MEIKERLQILGEIQEAIALGNSYSARAARQGKSALALSIVPFSLWLVGLISGMQWFFAAIAFAGCSLWQLQRWGYSLDLAKYYYDYGIELHEQLKQARESEECHGD